jgi:uncharacterized CHY-type Zn-finger protein
MCKHILNAQVAIRAPCCKKWFDCPECHRTSEDHELQKTTEMTFACKKCKKVFRKDLSTWEEADEFCPRCDNHFLIEAKTPETEGKLVVELEGSQQMLRDDREKQKNSNNAWMKGFRL